MITDRELDVRLAGAAVVHDIDLPALPEDLLRRLTGESDIDTGTGSRALEPASVIAARQLVSDAREARTATRTRRRPSRRSALRVGTAVLAIAAAWATAVLVSPSDPTAPPHHSGTPDRSISLVAAEEATFPLTLDPAPAGLTPVFSWWGGVPYYGNQPEVYAASYESGNGDRVLITLFAEDPRNLEEGGTVSGDLAGTVTVDGRKAEVWRSEGSVSLLWERPDGRWITVLGERAYAKTAALVTVGESIVDRPQPIGLQFGLAPAGWSLGGYEESRSLDLVSDTDPEQLPLRLSVIGRQGGATIDTPFEGRSFAGPVEAVTIKGQPGRMALADGGEGNTDYWIVVGQFPDGPLFLMLAPQVLTRDQVLEIAEQVTYTP